MNNKVERCGLTELAEHLCARRPCGDTPENVADWLDYSLNRCGLVVIPEQRLTGVGRLTGEVARLREALEFRPVPSETFGYQADGYAAGWNAAIAQYEANARTALQEGVEK